MIDPFDVLRRGVAGYHPYQAPSGRLDDPVFGEPTQYGTAYHAFANAVLAERYGEPYRGRAERGLDAALDDLLDLARPPTLAGFDRRTGETVRRNHRDFYWPPVLDAFRLLRDMGSPSERRAARIAALDIERAFTSRPPSNWAAVWISGEWVRIREGLSERSEQSIDAWLEPFFEERVLLPMGMYQEPGHPNSYDLFARLHLAELAAEDYRGRWRRDLDALLVTGLRRSLAVQLSDGSLASAHRSSGQTWTVGAQCAYFTLGARQIETVDRRIAARSRDAAVRALASFRRWQRPDGPYSPVENLLPPGHRVGYERYTADAHYGSLALAFLARAVRNGFDTPVPDTAPDRGPTVFVEGDPTWRAIVHHGPYSAHVNARPAPGYDAFGIADVTFGQGRLLHFVSAATHAGGAPLGIGLAGRGDGLAPIAPIEPDGPAGLVLEARPAGAPHRYRLRVAASEAGIEIDESTPGRRVPQALLVPYLRDAGAGRVTRVESGPGAVRFRHGAETVSLHLHDEIERVIDLTCGHESRRGLCGLLRIQFRDPTEGIRYRLAAR